MVKVIKPGFLKEIQCQKCGAILRYDEREDIIVEKTDMEDFNPDPYGPPKKYATKYIVCPQCKNKIVLNAVR